MSEQGLDQLTSEQGLFACSDSEPTFEDGTIVALKDSHQRYQSRSIKRRPQRGDWERQRSHSPGYDARVIKLYRSRPPCYDARERSRERPEPEETSTVHQTINNRQMVPYQDYNRGRSQPHLENPHIENRKRKRSCEPNRSCSDTRLVQHHTTKIHPFEDNEEELQLNVSCYVSQNESSEYR
jgi:hypothetical protein